MVFKGYLEVGGREVANSARAFGYATTADCPASWLKDPECAGITDALGDVAYDFANIDQAPWFDPDQADLSKRFLGVYPITVENLSDSTRTAEVTERSNDGGRIGGRRHTSRAVRVQAWLTAQGADAMDYGMGWLAAAVSAGACGQHNSRCGVADLSFFTDCPPGRVDVPDYTAWTPQAVDLFTNPGFEATSGTVEVRRNLTSRPIANAAWQVGYGTPGGAGAKTVEADSRFPGGVAVQAAWTSAPTGNNGLYVGPSDSIPVSEGGAYTMSVFAAVTNWPTFANYAYIYSPGITQVSAGVEDLGDGLYRVWRTVTINTGVTVVAPVVAVSGGVAMPTTSTTFRAGGALVELSPVVGDYFDGAFSPDPDLTPSWTGTPGASPSILTGQRVTGVTGLNGTAAIRSTRWSAEGQYSMRLIPLGSSGATTVDLSVVLESGKTYTVVAVGHLETPMTPGDGRARSIVLRPGTGGGADVVSQALPNTAGEMTVAATFTVADAATAHIFLFNGASQGNGDVWWDNVTIVEGVYDGPPFTGSSPDDYDQYGKAVAQYSWDGAEDASTSTRETRTRFYRPQSADEYEATVSPFRRFAHDVDATSGPFTVQEHKSSDGVHVGRLVEFTITAEDAFIYAATRQVPVLPSLPTVVQDTLYNLFPTPSMELTGGGSVVVATNYAQNPSVETNAAGWASNTVAITPAAAGARSTELAASGAASYKVSVTATNSGTNGQLLAYQDVSLASIPAGSKVSVGMWATLVRASGTAVLGNIAMRVDWLNSSSATISSTSLGTEPAAGGPLAATSLTPPAGAVTARVVAAGNVTSWSAGAVLALYADALSVTVP